MFLLSSLRLRPPARRKLFGVAFRRQIELVRPHNIKNLALTNLVPLFIGSRGRQFGGAIDFFNLTVDLGLQVLQQNILTFQDKFVSVAFVIWVDVGVPS